MDSKMKSEPQASNMQKRFDPSNSHEVSSQSDTAMKPTVILTSDDVGTRSSPPTDPTPSTSQATDFSKTPGLETSRSSKTVRVLHGNVERLGDAQERKVEVKRNAGPAARQHSPVAEARRVGARHRVTLTCTKLQKTFVHHMDNGTSEHLYRNSDLVVCPLVRIHAHASRHASSSTSQMATRDLSRTWLKAAEYKKQP
ncbi:hypothetical protein Q7P36_010008 [Cladosporium allicinum]